MSLALTRWMTVVLFQKKKKNLLGMACARTFCSDFSDVPVAAVNGSGDQLLDCVYSQCYACEVNE